MLVVANIEREEPHRRGSLLEVLQVKSTCSGEGVASVPTMTHYVVAVALPTM